MAHMYTQEQVAFLEENIRGRFIKDLTRLFNARFGLKCSYVQIKVACSYRGLVCGMDARFPPGHVPANKGKKGWCYGGKATQFKKGNRPPNYLPVGAEVPDPDDYIKVKIAEPNKWRHKHLLVWEAANGPLPPGHAVIFADRDNRNFSLDNLVKVTRAELLYLNRHGLIHENAELTKTAVNVASLATAAFGKLRSSRPVKEKPRKPARQNQPAPQKETPPAWRDIPGFPGYQFNRRGKVRTSSGYELSPQGRGYILSQAGQRIKVLFDELKALIPE